GIVPHGGMVGHPDILTLFLFIDIDRAIQVDLVHIGADIGQGKGIEYRSVGIELGKIVYAGFNIKGSRRIDQINYPEVPGGTLIPEFPVSLSRGKGNDFGVGPFSEPRKVLVIKIQAGVQIGKYRTESMDIFPTIVS